MTTFYRKSAAGLPFVIGIEQSDGSRSSDGEKGFISFGPHMSLPAGSYFGGFYVRALERSTKACALKLDVTSGGGTVAIAAREFAGREVLTEISGLIGTTFILDKEESGIEVRLFVCSDVLINVRELTIFETSRPAV